MARDQPAAWGVVCAAVLFAACDGGAVPPLDAGAPGDGGDASTAVIGPDIPWLAAGIPPLATGTCAPGWHPVVDRGVATCEPYPTTGAERCAPGSAHFPGAVGCSPLGDPCPSGDFADSLPPSGTLYVRAGAPPGGDGSRASPFAALADVSWAALSGGTTVALAKGAHSGVLPLPAGVAVIGACAGETIVTGLAGAARAVVTVTTVGEPALVRNVTIADAPQRGVDVTSGSRLRLEGVAIERSYEVGVNATGVGAEIVLEDVVVQSTAPSSDGTYGRGIVAENGARIDATRIVVEDNHDLGVSASSAGTELSLTDAVVRGTRPQASDGDAGRGMQVQLGAHVTATRFLVEQNHDAGLVALSVGTLLSLSTTIVRDTAPREGDAAFGIGATVGDGALLRASAVVIERNRNVGLLVTTGADALLEDVVIRDTESQASDGTGGAGIAVQYASHLDASRVVLLANRTTGLLVTSAGTQVSLADVAVLSTRARASDAEAGHGVQVQSSAALEGSRLLVAESLGLGVVSFLRANVELSDVAIRAVAGRACSETTCVEAPFGYGANAIAGTLRMTRFSVVDAETCGLFLAVEGAGLDVTSGVVSGSEIGACVQVVPYDFSRLTDGVMYRDNAINLDTTSLPVPTG